MAVTPLNERIVFVAEIDGDLEFLDHCRLPGSTPRRGKQSAGGFGS